MKKIIDVLIVNEEEDITLAKRREDYALKRDIQASEQNEAITKRLVSEEVAKITCEKCGNEFTPSADSENISECPECL